jgi:hypothetical protein
VTDDSETQCRPGCGACCVAPSISSDIPGMKGGKPAGVPCVQLTPDYRCALFRDPSRPACCGGLRPSPEMCGANRGQALAGLARLEALTAPYGEGTCAFACLEPETGD